MVRRGLVALLGVVILFAVYAASVAYPKWAFSYEGGTEGLRIHSTVPLPPETEAFAARVEADLAASALEAATAPLHLYITGDGWRRSWFFAQYGFAGGITYPVIAPRHAFLADADIEADRMFKGGTLVPLPRSATVYGVHELAHLLTLQQVGLWAYIQMDPILREGIADYVALGPAPPEMQADVRNAVGDDPDAALRDKWGSYPSARVMLTYVLESGRTIADLLAR